MSLSLLFDDSVELCGSRADATGPYWFETHGESASFGDPQPVEVTIESLLRDGALTQTESDGNREASFVVTVKSVDSLGLAQGMAALHRCIGRRTTLVWSPPDGIAPATVFDVETSSLGEAAGFDDLAFLRNEMAVTLRLVCQPYAHSAGMTTEIAEAVPSVGTTVNAADSLTGWSTTTAVVPGTSGYVTASPQPSSMLVLDTTSKVEGTSSVAAKAWRVQNVRVTGVLPGGDGRPVDAQVALTQAISAPAGGYLSFAVKFDNTFGQTITNSYWNQTFQQFGTLDTFTINTASASLVYKNQRSARDDTLLTDGIIEPLADGWTRYTFRINSALSITSLSWTSEHLVPWTTDPYVSDRPRILIDQVALASTATLGNQVIKTLNVGGSARTTGALHIAAPSDSVALGQVLAFTISQAAVAPGFRPNLGQWVASGAHTATVGGQTAWDQIGSAYGSTGSPVLVVPASVLKSGAYTIAGSVYRTTTTLAFIIEASLMMGSTVIATQQLAVNTTISATTWVLQSFGTLYLPPALVQYPTTDATVRFRFRGASPPSLGELYVLPVEGDLTIVNCGTGTVGSGGSSSHAWIDSPSADQPQGGYWRGSTPTRSNALSAWASVTVPGTHSFDAGQMLAFVASSVAQGPTVSFDYRKAWLFHAAE